MKFKLSNCFLLIVSLLLLSQSAGNAQDTLYFSKGDYIVGRVLKVLPNEIVYQRINNGDTVVFSMERRHISSIHYSEPGRKAQEINSAPVYLPKSLRIWIFSQLGEEVMDGFLTNYNDSNLFIAKHRGFLDFNRGLEAELMYIVPAENIYEIQVRSRKKIRLYATLGAAGGLVLGTLTGLAVFRDDKPCISIGPDSLPCDDSLKSPRTRFEKSLTFGAGMGGAGFIAGGLVGGARISIPIGGKKEYLHNSTPSLMMLSSQQ
jgi:hypothetical protein